MFIICRNIGLPFVWSILLTQASLGKLTMENTLNTENKRNQRMFHSMTKCLAYIFLLCQLQPQQPQQPQVESCCPWRLAPVGRTRGTAPPGWQPPPLPAAPPASSKDRATLRSVPQCLQRIPSQFVGLQFHTHCCVSNSSAV